jgi:predicted MFS family arabinose efflux permease
LSSAEPERHSVWRMVGFFLLLHILNQVDRQLVAAFASDIMRDLSLNRTEFALIASLAFSGVYAFASLVAGVLADRFGRVPVLASGLGVWSLFTALAGLAQGFWSMLAVRPFVAAGEATLVPTACNIILARVNERDRAAALGLFFAGIPLGIGCGFLVAGALGPIIGWRGTFVLMGVLGMLAVVAVLRTKDDPPDRTQHANLASNLLELLQIYRSNRRARWTALAMIIAHAHLATSIFVQLWLVAEKGFTAGGAAKLYGTMFAIVGLIGTFGSGLLGDWIKRRYGWDRAATVFAIMLLLAPLLPVYRLAPSGSALFLVGMTASILFITVIYGPLFTVLDELLPLRVKATAAGVNILLLNIVVIGCVAVGIGFLSDRLASMHIERSWTWPLMIADCIAVMALPMIWLAIRERTPLDGEIPALVR